MHDHSKSDLVNLIDAILVRGRRRLFEEWPALHLPIERYDAWRKTFRFCQDVPTDAQPILAGVPESKACTCNHPPPCPLHAGTRPCRRCYNKRQISQWTGEVTTQVPCPDCCVPRMIQP